MSRKSDKRGTSYDRQPWYKRWYLWFRFMPAAYLMTAYSVLLWLLHGAPTYPDYACPSRRKTLCVILRVHIGMAECRMGRTYTIEQMIRALKQKRKKEKSSD